MRNHLPYFVYERIDCMYKGFWGWSLENVGKGTVETKYEVKYITDSKVADELERTGCDDLFIKRNFSNVSEALAFYLIRFVNDSYIIVQLWEQVYVNKEMILEQMIEPDGYIKSEIMRLINNEMRVRMNHAEIEVQELRRKNDLYKKFIDKFGKSAKEQFKEFVEQEAK